MSEPGPQLSRPRRLAAYLVAPVDPASVAVFRILFGLILADEALRYIRFGWLRRNYLEPAHMYHYYGFEWVRVLDPLLMYGLFAVCAVAGMMIAAGFLYRVAAPVFFVGVAYWFLLDQSRYLNHMYLVVLYAFLLCVVPAHRAWSADALVFRTASSGYMPRWGVWILRFQMGCVYFFGGVAKINRDWLMDAEPLRMWLSRRPESEVAELAMLWTHSPLFMSWAGFLIDFLAVPFLLWKRTRVPMLLILVAFHLLNKSLFNIGIFPWLSLAATLLFLDPSWPRRFLRLPEFRVSAIIPTRTPFLVPAILIPFVALQLFLPLRHYLYPSDVAWSEEGHRFSWRMKLRTKVGEGYFMVQTEDMSYIEIVSPESFIHRGQVRSVLTRPDMILQAAKYLAAEKEKQLGRPVQVFAHVTCQLNHHEPQLLVDPAVDLTRVRRSLGHADWTMPFNRSPIRYWEQPSMEPGEIE